MLLLTSGYDLLQFSFIPASLNFLLLCPFAFKPIDSPIDTDRRPAGSDQSLDPSPNIYLYEWADNTYKLNPFYQQIYPCQVLATHNCSDGHLQFAIKNDVDCLIFDAFWKQTAPYYELQHTATFDAMAYISKAKEQRKILPAF